MSEQLDGVILESLRVRITKVLPAQVRECLDQLSDDEIWSRPNENANSVGNLVLHLTGSLNHYLNHLIGGMDFARNREAEFAERRRIPKAELRSGFDEMIARAEVSLAAVTPARLSDPSPEQKMNRFLVQDLLNIAIHLATHTGQILWITKMFKSGGLHDLWIKTHRELGAWKK